MHPVYQSINLSNVLRQTPSKSSTNGQQELFCILVSQNCLGFSPWSTCTAYPRSPFYIVYTEDNTFMYYSFWPNWSVCISESVARYTCMFRTGNTFIHGCYYSDIHVHAYEEAATSKASYVFFLLMCAISFTINQIATLVYCYPYLCTSWPSTN